MAKRIEIPKEGDTSRGVLAGFAVVSGGSILGAGDTIPSACKDAFTRHVAEYVFECQPKIVPITRAARDAFDAGISESRQFVGVVVAPREYDALMGSE